MRITCPNCGAQYEVPNEVIPPEGRDVQCSNCGDTWYQSHIDPASAEPEHEDVSGPSAEEPSTPEPPKAPEPEPIAEEPPQASEPEPEAEEPQQASEPEVEEAPQVSEPEQPEPESEEVLDDGQEITEGEDGGDSPEDVAEPKGEEEPAPRELDPAVADILRQEAEHEASIRATEVGDGLESQPDLGLDNLPDDEASRRSREAQERMAKMRGETPEDMEQGDDAASRRGLLPDIDEINSTLRASGEGADVDAAIAVGAQRQSGGFTRGFGIMIVLVLILVLIYANASKIAIRVPPLAPVLEMYVAKVDQGRIWLDGKISSFTPK